MFMVAENCPYLCLEDGARLAQSTSRLFLFYLHARGRAAFCLPWPRLAGRTSTACPDKESRSTSLLQDFNVILHIKRIQMTRMNGSSQPHGLIF